MRICIMFFEYQVKFRRLMAALLDRRPVLEVIAQAGSLPKVVDVYGGGFRVGLTVPDLVTTPQALRLNKRG
jgi:hypothetical protein